MATHIELIPVLGRDTVRHELDRPPPECHAAPVNGYPISIREPLQRSNFLGRPNLNHGHWLLIHMWANSAVDFVNFVEYDAYCRISHVAYTHNQLKNHDI